MSRWTWKFCTVIFKACVLNEWNFGFKSEYLSFYTSETKGNQQKEKKKIKSNDVVVEIKRYIKYCFRSFLQVPYKICLRHCNKKKITYENPVPVTSYFFVARQQKWTINKWYWKRKKTKSVKIQFHKFS